MNMQNQTTMQKDISPFNRNSRLLKWQNYYHLKTVFQTRNSLL